MPALQSFWASVCGLSGPLPEAWGLGMPTINTLLLDGNPGNQLTGKLSWPHRPRP